MKLRYLFLAILVSLSFSGCSLLWPVPAQTVVALPPAPVLQECPQLPDIQGDIIGGTVSLKLEDAQKLQQWIHQYIQCSQSNQVELQGYAEKLVNRLKALATVQ